MTDTSGMHAIPADIAQCFDMPKVAIGVVSRNRPRMLAQLLETFCALQPIAPRIEPKADYLFIIVENGDVRSPEYVHAVAQFRECLRKAMPASEVIHAHEPHLGIPYARNKALDLAIEHRCDFLAFTDDDCRVPPNWAAVLMFVQGATDSDMVSGLIRYTLDQAECSCLTRFQRFWGRAMIASAEETYRRERSRKIPGNTGNLLINLAFIQKHHVRFDETNPLAAGEDRKFARDCARLGAVQETATDAVVWEIITRDRISVRMTICKSMHALTANHMRKRKGRLHAAGGIVVDALLCMINIARFVAGHSAALVKFCQRFGRLMGGGGYICGIGRGEFYRKTTGR